jgi:hypothetical protein
MGGRDALDEERAAVDPDDIEAIDLLMPEEEDDSPVLHAEPSLTTDDDDPWFPEWLAEKVSGYFGAKTIPHPSDAANPAFRLPGDGGQAIQHLARGLAAQEALRTRLAGDPFALRLVEEMAEGLGMAELIMLMAREQAAADGRITNDLRRRAAQTFQATIARRQRGEPKRQWAIEQRALHPEWSWTMLCQQVEAEFGLSEGAGRTVLASIRHLVDPKQAANCNDPKRAA